MKTIQLNLPYSSIFSVFCRCLVFFSIKCTFHVFQRWCRYGLKKNMEKMNIILLKTVSMQVCFDRSNFVHHFGAHNFIFGVNIQIILRSNTSRARVTFGTHLDVKIVFVRALGLWPRVPVLITFIIIIIIITTLVAIAVCA